VAKIGKFAEKSASLDTKVAQSALCCAKPVETKHIKAIFLDYN
jgi:hypothetical protein